MDDNNVYHRIKSSTMSYGGDGYPHFASSHFSKVFCPRLNNLNGYLQSPPTDQNMSIKSP